MLIRMTTIKNKTMQKPTSVEEVEKLDPLGTVVGNVKMVQSSWKMVW